MRFKLETPEHQKTAIQNVVEIFHGMEKNTYDNDTDEGVRADYCSLSLEALFANIHTVVEENEVDQPYFLDKTVDFFMEHPDTKFICIERALDTTKKFNLKNKMQEKFFAF